MYFKKIFAETYFFFKKFYILSRIFIYLEHIMPINVVPLQRYINQLQNDMQHDMEILCLREI